MDQYSVTGMSCAACQSRVEKAVSRVPGVTACSVSLLTNSMGVEGNAEPSEIIRAVKAAGYGASRRGNGKPGSSGGMHGAGQTAETEEEELLMDRETPVLKKRLILSVGFLAILMYISMGHNMWGWPLPAWLEGNLLGLGILQLLLAATVMIINQKFFTGGFRSLFRMAPNMDTLVALGSSVSFAWSVTVLLRMGRMAAEGAAAAELHMLYHDELYFESAAMIPALITVGKMLEAISKGRTTNALKSLMGLAPKTATLIREGKEVTVPVREVMVGDVFALRPGESVPVDGLVLEGESAVDESALTGESIPVDKAAGDTVSTATMNRSGYLKCRAVRVGEDTALGQIIRMVSDAAATKAPIARIADRVSGVFVPVVMGIALITVVGWLVAGQTAAFALARGISVLVISCPCALGLATPVAIMVGNGVGAKCGILFKTGESLENAGRSEIIVLDKTGTVTEGTPKVTDVIPADGVTEAELLRKAGLLEARSEHPLARAVVAYLQEHAGQAEQEGGPDGTRKNEVCSDGGAPEGRNKDEEAEMLQEFLALPGNGLQGILKGHRLVGGSGTYIRTIVKLTDAHRRTEAELADAGKTPLFFAEDGRLLGIIAVADGLRGDSRDAVRQLKDLGMDVVMLTGDNQRAAAAMAKAAGIRHVVAGVLPEGKAAVVHALQASGRVAMVGDGINDAPALTRADLGIAIGAGTDVAKNSADVVLMNSSLSDVAAAVRISRGTLRNIHQNLFWAFFYNVICIPLAAGLFPWKLNPMIGAAAMSLSSFTVCMNALRLNRMHPKRRGNSRKMEEKTETTTGQDRNEESGRRKKGNISVEEALELFRKEKERDQKMTKTVKIEGMMCGHCEMTVKKAMEALPFVESAEVSHEAGTAVLTLSKEPDEAMIREAVEAKDFTYGGMV